VRTADIKALGELAGDALAAGGGFIKGMHEGIASRPFEILGPAAAPARVVHDGIAQSVYAALSDALRAASREGAALLAQHGREDDASLAATPGAR
jgi:hypothetical protein